MAMAVIRWSYVSPINVNPGADGILRALESLAASAAGVDAVPDVDVPEAEPVELVEYGDYECPYCRKAYTIVRQIQERFGGRLHVQFRNFPLSQIHPYAKHGGGSRSVRANAGEDAFWRMHDALFEHQRDSADALDDAHPRVMRRRLAPTVPGCVPTWTRKNSKRPCRWSSWEEFVRVNATPTFFINGERFDGDWRDVEQLAAAIEEAAAGSTLVAAH
jgi:protein-disulfide isomerase